jgi:DNA-directed RNA polymerase specialized sigma24 family protein
LTAPARPLLPGAPLFRTSPRSRGEAAEDGASLPVALPSATATRPGMSTTSDDVPPPFTAKQARTIRKIGRRCGFPRNELEDLVQIVWLELKNSWAKCPRVEPGLSKYVNGIARNTANGIIRKRRDDATTGAQRFGSVDEETATAPVNLTLSDRAMAHQLLDKARNRDPEGAEWMVRTKMQGESFPEVSEDVGQPPDRIRMRVNRLIEWLREHAGVVSLILLCLLAAALSFFKPKPKTGPDTADSNAPQNLTPKQTATLERDGAFAACDIGDWGKCAAMLDEAKALDPAGENDARVRGARGAIARANPPPPTEAPKAPLKPDVPR